MISHETELERLRPILREDVANVLIALEDVIVIRQEIAGPAAARNTGLARATAPFIAFLDDDDLWMPGRLRALLEILAAHPQTIPELLVRRRVHEANDSAEPVAFREILSTLHTSLRRRRAQERPT